MSGIKSHFSGKQNINFIDFSLSDLSPAKKRPLEKENCNVPTSSSSNNSHSDILLRTTSPYVAANDHIPYRSSLFSIEWYRSNIPRLLRRLVPIQIRETIR
jgi:hypothetical protein